MCKQADQLDQASNHQSGHKRIVPKFHLGIMSGEQPYTREDQFGSIIGGEEKEGEESVPAPGSNHHGMGGQGLRGMATAMCRGRHRRTQVQIKPGKKRSSS